MTFALSKQIKRGQQKAFGSTFPTRGRGVMGTSGPRDLGMGLVGSKLLLAGEAAVKSRQPEGFLSAQENKLEELITNSWVFGYPACWGWW